MNIYPRPVLPLSMLSTIKAPRILPLYSLIKIIAGSMFLVLLRKVLKALPSRLAEKAFCQLYSL